MLLVTCRALRRLTLTHIELSDETLCGPIQSPIERLELHQVTLTSENINNVLKYCMHLTSFTARKCYWRITSMKAVIGVQLQLPPRHFHSVQMDDQRIIWMISTYTITWEPIQEYGLFAAQHQHHVNNSTVGHRRWLRIMTSLEQETKLVKRQPQPVTISKLVELPPGSMEPLLQTSYDDVLRMHTATNDSSTTTTAAAAINDHSSCIAKRGGFMMISFTNIKHIALNGLAVQS
ncbi:hypothetical protein BDB00DRAFT_376407 [Zychaea mexicana]|uniref:uncharacterized protein n=1 Tax=Zychaea mexicana TaxID=64656 RepID=UPI0022FDC846|nr:uncharacterized protein BDB00DRAFT_376407 [Zychaea mexicana]KAI9493344.1 hypothetical protein BDB00DRAFT_376407 [Zychaea mexicana]